MESEFYIIIQYPNTQFIPYFTFKPFQTTFGQILYTLSKSFTKGVTAF